MNEKPREAYDRRNHQIDQLLEIQNFATKHKLLNIYTRVYLLISSLIDAQINDLKTQMRRSE